MEAEGHNQKFANAFASILADEQPDGPDKKKPRTAPSDAVRGRLQSFRVEGSVHLFRVVDLAMSHLVWL